MLIMIFLKISLVLLTVLCNFFLSLLVLFSNPKKIVNQVFSLICFALGAWSLSLFFYEFPIIFNSFFWIKTTYVIIYLVMPLILFFTFIFPHSEKKLLNAAFFFSFTYIIFSTFLLFFTDLWVSGVFTDKFGLQSIIGKGYLWWGISTWLVLLWAVINLLIKSQKATGAERAQLQYVSLGFFLWGFLVCIPDFYLPLVANNTRYFSISPIFSLSFVGLATYAIIKHRLMDLRIILRGLITKILILVSISTICIFATYFYGGLLGYEVHWESVFSIFGAITLTVFSFPYFSHKAEYFTRKFLIKGGYDPKIFIKKLTDILNSTIGFEQMVIESAETITKGLNVKFASFLLIISGEEKNLSNYKIISSQNGIKKWENLTSLIEFLQFHHEPFVLEEFEKKKNLEIKKPPQEIINQLKENEIAVIFPLKIKSKISGFIFLGNKPAVDSFTANDIDVLETFASQASFAIENARLFSEVQSFNERLKEEIQRATGELTSQNKFLAALRRLDLIIMELLSLEDLCQKIVNSLSWELKCQFTIIGLVDEIKNRLYFKSASADSDLAKELVRKRLLLEDIYFPLGKENGILTKAISTKRSYSSSELKDIFSPHLSEETIQKWQTLFKVQTIWVYPIISQGRALGICVFAWEKAESEISSKDRDLMQNVIDQTGIALDRTLLYEKLKVSNRRLKIALTKQLELDRMKDEFVSIASHELRTPMTSINSYLWMVLNKKGGEINPKQKFYLERAAISTQRSINLVNDMLTVSRIEGGKLGVNLVEGDILSLAQTITDELQPKAKEKKVKLFLESPSIELPLVVLDSEKIREVLNNLIGNAIKFTDPQGQVVVSFKKKGNFVFTFITDTGRGIAKSDIPKLFKKFGRLDRSFATVAETGGTGLGLYISKQIIDLHHGKIGVESKPAKGSTFYFSLKAARGK